MEDIIAGGDFQKLKVTDLKKVLKEKGLSQSGSKSELIERLQANLPLQDALADTDEPLVVQEEEEESEEVQTTVGEWTDNSKKEEDLLSLTPDKASNITKPTKITFENPESKTDTSTKDVLQVRADRFGNQNEDMKKKSRAERFGNMGPLTNAQNTPSKKAMNVISSPAGDNLEKLKKRAERFGTAVSTTMTKVEEQDRIRKRKERFGTPTNNTVSIGKTSDETEEKKRKRAERFGLT